MEVVRQDDGANGNHGWRAFYLGNEGKRRLAQDIVLPNTATEQEIERILSDLFHEYATPKHPRVERLK